MTSISHAVPAPGLLGSLDPLQITLDGAVIHVRLNRPAKRNSISDPLIRQLHTCFVNLPDHVKAAVVSGEGAHFSRLIGVARMSDLMLTGRVFDAEEARQMGLVNRTPEAQSRLRDFLEGRASKVAKP